MLQCLFDDIRVNLAYFQAVNLQNVKNGLSVCSLITKSTSLGLLGKNLLHAVWNCSCKSHLKTNFCLYFSLNF